MICACVKYVTMHDGALERWSAGALERWSAGALERASYEGLTSRTDGSRRSQGRNIGWADVTRWDQSQIVGTPTQPVHRATSATPRGQLAQDLSRQLDASSGFLARGRGDEQGDASDHRRLLWSTSVAMVAGYSSVTALAGHSVSIRRVVAISSTVR
jgi:hypothetical protein